MGGRGGGGESNGAGKGNNGILGVPAGSTKIVQSLKEVVNCSELEIYATLVECNMDPDEAVNRLLSQDTFHEVRSKRDKKKENKETTDSRLCGANNNSNRGARVGIDSYAGCGGSVQFSSNEHGGLLGKPANKRESGTRAYACAESSGDGLIGRQPQSNSDSTHTENKRSLTVLGDAIPSSSQASSGNQPAWFGAPGQISMADIVKMGRPHHHNYIPPHSSEDIHSKVSEMKTEHKAPSKDEWPSIEKPATSSVSSVLKTPTEPELCADKHLETLLDEDHLTENPPVGSACEDQARPASVSSRSVQEDDSGGSSLFDDNMYKNMDSYQTQRHSFELNGAGDVTSSVGASLQQLTIENDGQRAQPEEDKPGVMIPNHLQVHTSECLHLSFGSFGSGIGSGLSGNFASRPINDDLGEISEVAEGQSIGHSDTRDAEFYGDEPLGSVTDGNMGRRIDANAGTYDSSSDSQTEVLKQETPEADHNNQYTFSSAPGYAIENSQQLNSAFAPPQTSPQMQNLDALYNVMQAYTNSLPSTLLPSTVENVREPDLQYSPFPVTQSMPTKYSSAATSLAGPTISMVEALRTAGIPAPQPTQQTVPSASVAAGPALAQHLAMHPYSQPALPLGHYANMMSYPFLPQSYAYMPSAFQQAFAGDSTYHQSLAAMLPQYKNNNVSVSNLPQSPAVAPGYGFGGSSSVPGGKFPINPSSVAGSIIGYNDILRSQFKDSNHLSSLQQNENSATWLQGPGSRTISSVPGSTYYSFPGQNQQPPGFRQGQQQPSQHFGALGYPNIYHSQTGMSQDHHQQQNPRDGSLLQGQASKQLWQNSY